MLSLKFFCVLPQIAVERQYLVHSVQIESAVFFFLVNGLPYGYKQNSYVVNAGDSKILIDSGDLWFRDPPGAFETIQENCENWRINATDVTHLFITHSHFDHASHAARWQKTGVKIVSSKETAEAMEAGDDRCIGYAVNRQFEPCKADIIVEDEQVIEIGNIKVRCIGAPGHADGCMIYEMVLDGKTCWFIGDIVEVTSASYSGCPMGEVGFSGGPDFDKDRLVETLQKMCHMNFDYIFPGHGPVCLKYAMHVIEQGYTQAMCELR